MRYRWEETRLKSKEKVLDTLAELRAKGWLSRGQPKHYRLRPSIDRDGRGKLVRRKKLRLERKAIACFQTTTRFFTDSSEKAARYDDLQALLVLQHFGAPTRVLDWSMSPYVAAYFAVENDDAEDGEIWTFDEPLYEQKGAEQWRKWPETTTDGSGDGSKFRAELTAFAADEPPDWFVCIFYRDRGGFPRQDAQEGVFSMTARFGRDHADMIARLLGDRSKYHRYVISAKLKRRLRTTLREEFGIWRGPLFPDSAGAAETARRIFKDTIRAAKERSRKRPDKS